MLSRSGRRGNRHREPARRSQLVAAEQTSAIDAPGRLSCGPVSDPHYSPLDIEQVADPWS